MAPASRTRSTKPQVAADTPRKRAFKTKWFAREAARRAISDSDLCDAIVAVQLGQADNLGGGVWKKRLNDNRDRSIILAKGGRLWIFVYLFQKSARENIEDDELAGFKKLAKAYEMLDEKLLDAALAAKELMEIYYD